VRYHSLAGFLSCDRKEHAMPAIIVQSNGSTEQDTNVILYEDVQPEHLASDHHAAQLIERVGWAVSEAKAAEDAGSQ
jgi:hypothetical protein